MPRIPFIRAREIMGKNFLEISDAAKYLGIYPSPTEEDSLPHWITERLLKQCRESHILVIKPPCSIFRLQNNPTSCRLFSREEQVWSQESRGTLHHQGRPTIELIRKALVAGSEGNYWPMSMYSKEQPASIGMLVYVMVLQYLKQGEILLQNNYAYSSTLDRNNRRFYAGTAHNGIVVCSCTTNLRSYHMGVSGSRKH